MQLLVLLLGALLSATIAFATNWLALIPWRRAKDKHWTEQARVYHPVRTAAVSNLWVIPAVMVLLGLHLSRLNLPSWILIALFSALGVIVGTLPMDREVFPRIALRDLMRQAITGSFLRFLVCFVFLSAAVLMPDEFNLQTLSIVLAVVALWILWNRDLWLHLGLRIGFVKPPPERLREIVNDSATKMNVTVREIWVLNFPVAQAFALPDTRKLLFSDRLLELLPDNELAAVCSHELAHLTEKRGQYLKRYISLLTWLPWLLLKPLMHHFGALGFLMLLATTLFVPVVFRKLSHKLEIRADDMAQANESDPGVYARALSRLHEDALIPAVVAKEQLTHPHLYDRLLAAGVTPDYPRPKAANSTAWHGTVFATALGLLAGTLILGNL